MDHQVTAAIDRIDVSAYRIPTDAPESDGTLKWDSTEVVVAHVHAGGNVGLGWTYAARAAAILAKDILAPVAMAQSALSIEEICARDESPLAQRGTTGRGHDGNRRNRYRLVGSQSTDSWRLR